jgi:1-acyl-sn-glycerol-3-phosphate acyltransferase
VKTVRLIKKSKEAVASKFAKTIHEKKRSVVIFHRGTRSRTGVPKPFQVRGLQTIFIYVPDAVVVHQ